MQSLDERLTVAVAGIGTAIEGINGSIEAINLKDGAQDNAIEALEGRVDDADTRIVDLEQLEPSGIIIVSENDKTGYALAGVDRTDRSPIGRYAVDLGTGTGGATGEGSVVVGRNNIAGGQASLVVGADNTEASMGNIVAGTGNVVTVPYNLVVGQGNTANYGPWNLVGGQDNKAGVCSSVSGQGNTAEAFDIVGGENNLSSYASIVGGRDNISSGGRNLVVGDVNKAGGDSIVGGSYNTATGFYNLVVGSNNSLDFDSASGSHSIVGGQSNTIQGFLFASMICGSDNVVGSANMAIISGSSNKGGGFAGLMLGSGNKNLQDKSFTVISGVNNEVHSDGAVAMGYDNVVHEAVSLAFGMGNEVTEQGSAVIGIKLINNTKGSVVVGSYNEVKEASAFEVGIGYKEDADSPEVRANGLEVYRNGAVIAPLLDDAVIVDNHSLVTKQWVEARLLPLSGDTDSRPENPPVGTCYYDTEIERPIWFTGEKWVNGMGGDLTTEDGPPSSPRG